MTHMLLLHYFDRPERFPEGIVRDTFVSFGDLARLVFETLPAGPETTAALRHVLEGMDAALRVAYDHWEEENPPEPTPPAPVV